MRKMKGIVAILMTIFLLVCSGFLVHFFSKKSENNKVVVTIFPIYDICRNIMGSGDDITLLQDNGVDMHSYQPSAIDIVSIAKSELFIYIGGESDEKLVDNVLSTIGDVDFATLKLMDCVNLLKESTEDILDGEHSHEHEHEHEHQEHIVYDEHIWLSIQNMKKMTNFILAELLEVFPERENNLKNNALKYLNELDVLHKSYVQVCAMQTSTIVVADRFPFIYLAHDYGLDFLAAYHGCSTDIKVTASTIVALKDKVNKEELNYLCVLETSDKKVADCVIRESSCREGVSIITLDSCQSISASELEKVSYISIMESNLENIKKVITNEIN